MPTPAECEALENRAHFAASVGLDPKYLFSDAAVRKTLGGNASYYQAVPAPGDRTYLLAERYADANDTGSTGYLTIIAVNADGKLDPSFGTGGIALTGRITQKHYTFNTSGILRLDTAGRLYFADDTRVLRFRANGTADVTFGNHGAIAFASADQSVGLCDMTTTADGVLVATMETHKGIEYFAVQSVAGQKVRAVWSTSHRTGVKDLETGGTSNPGYQQLHPDIAQFTRSAGGLVLARVEADYATRPYTEGPDDDDPGAVIQVSTLIGQNVVVSRLDSAGHATDVLRKELRRDNGQTNLGIEFTLDYFADESMVLSPKGRTLIVQTSAEILQLDLKTGSIHRYPLPGERYGDHNPRYQLLPDGNMWVRDERYDDTLSEFYFEISEYRLNGTLVTSFAKKGTLTVRQSDLAASGVTQYVHQLFLSSSGQLSLNASGSREGLVSMTLGRV